ncbi:VOC family protein [soil metagenome]
MITGIDHIVIMVSDLETAARQWGDLGFTVVPGGKHPRGTHNALIAFDDGSYLELIAFWEPDYDAHKWHKFKDSGIGLIDHALGSDDLAREVEDLNARGIEYVGPTPGARSRPDGVELAWRTAQPAGAADHGLPFLIDDVSDRALRVPSGDQARHSNGVMGIDKLEIVVENLAGVVTRYGAIVGAEPAPGADHQSIGQPSQSAVLIAGPHRIELHRPDGPGDASARVSAYGDGPYAVRFYGSESFEPNPNELDGARISCVTEPS